MDMARLIMKPAVGFVVDHKNRCGLDNRRANLRVLTHAENIRKDHVSNKCYI